MIRTLKKLQKANTPIRVGLVGAGSMGFGIAHQVCITPGMELTWIADKKLIAAEKTSAATADCVTGDSVEHLLQEHPVDVLVESTNSIQSALRYCELAIQSKAHVILMNAEVDLAFGPYLAQLADEYGVIISSDAGDQHGVLATMIEEITLWGFDIVQAGNIKGFLKRDATVESLAHEAAIRNLNPVQCCAYTDGTKLNIEMAVIANALGYLPTQTGMTGPRAERVEQALELFDFSEYPKEGVIDYILGAEPGGGVYVIARCEAEVQLPYLTYYKLQQSDQGHYYLFYRPYHLCHLETPKAIYKAVIEHEALLQPWAGRATEVYAYAKADFPAGTVIEEGIGSDVVYGMVSEVSKSGGQVPVVTLEVEGEKPVLKRDVTMGQALLYSDIEWLDRSLIDQYLQPSNLPSL
ncbi:MAG: homoserine dehydrogenase [Akkermansiaceae bacterium]